jgi:acetyltransferase-like isoleucine patch superfamily enzyme
MLLSRILSKANSIWLKSSYPFDSFGNGVSIHFSCEIQRTQARRMSIGDRVLLDREVWLNAPVPSRAMAPVLFIGNGSNIGRRSVISAKNEIRIQENVLFAPAVFVTDHNHEYKDPTRPISEQGVTDGGRIVIEKNCWLGYGSMVIAARGTVVIGRNSVIGAYSVVTESCAPYSVLVGNPARVARRLDPESGQWKKQTRVSV